MKSRKNKTNLLQNKFLNKNLKSKFKKYVKNSFKTLKKIDVVKILKY